MTKSHSDFYIFLILWLHWSRPTVCNAVCCRQDWIWNDFMVVSLNFLTLHALCENDFCKIMSHLIMMNKKKWDWRFLFWKLKKKKMFASIASKWPLLTTHYIPMICFAIKWVWSICNLLTRCFLSVFLFSKILWCHLHKKKKQQKKLNTSIKKKKAVNILWRLRIYFLAIRHIIAGHCIGFLFLFFLKFILFFHF